MNVPRRAPAFDSREPVPVPVPEPTVVNGRWTWPDILYYVIEGPPGAPDMVTIADTPPCEREAPALAAERKGLNKAEGEARTPPYHLVVKPGKILQVEALRRTGALQDPRHIGTADGPLAWVEHAHAPRFLSMRAGLGPVPYWAKILMDRPTESDFAASVVIYVIPPIHRELTLDALLDKLRVEGGKWPTVQRKKADANVVG